MPVKLKFFYADTYQRILTGQIVTLVSGLEVVVEVIVICTRAKHYSISIARILVLGS